MARTSFLSTTGHRSADADTFTRVLRQVQSERLRWGSEEHGGELVRTGALAGPYTYVDALAIDSTPTTVSRAGSLRLRLQEPMGWRVECHNWATMVCVSHSPSIPAWKQPSCRLARRPFKRPDGGPTWSAGP